MPEVRAWNIETNLLGLLLSPGSRKKRVYDNSIPELKYPRGCRRVAPEVFSQ